MKTKHNGQAIPNPHLSRGPPESCLDVVEKLAESLLSAQGPRHGIVSVVHRGVVLVQEEQQSDLRQQVERARAGGGG